MSYGVLHNRVSRFLSEYLPFSYMNEGDLLELTKKATMKFFDKGEIIFSEGSTPPPYFYVVQQGSVELSYNEDGEEIVSEIVDMGDIFGLKALLGKRNYINTAKAREETLLIVLPFSIMEGIINKEAKIGMYFAAGFSSGRSKVNMNQINQVRKTLSRKYENNNAIRQADSIHVFKNRAIIYCNPNTTILEAAKIMTQKKVGSILVLDYEDRPVGIVTDVDFRKKVICNQMNLNEPVSSIMSSPVITVRKDITLAETLITMMNKNIRHLCITRDGTDKTPVEGIVTEHDIMLLQGNTPAVITKQIYNSENIKEIKELRDQAEDLMKTYLEEELSLSFIFEMITQVNDAMIQRLIEIAIKDLGEPPVSFAWLSLGSEGRKEQVLRTDQDNAILYENPQPEKKESVKNYFLELAKKVNDSLYECGFAYCKGEVMAKNPKWCASFDDWKMYFLNWIESPTPKAIMHFSIFFDLRPVYENKSLVEDLEKFIHNQIQKNPNCLRYLALNSVSSTPPLGMWKGFAVEKHGEHKDQFDIKARGTVPIVDAARVLALEVGITEKNTMERWKKLAEKKPDRKDEYLEMSATFEIVSRIRIKNNLYNPQNGNYINPANLNKIDKETLKYAFQIIREMQKKLEVHFRLDLIPH